MLEGSKVNIEGYFLIIGQIFFLLIISCHIIFRRKLDRDMNPIVDDIFMANGYVTNILVNNKTYKN